MKPLKRFVALDKKLHDRTSFDCQKETINHFLKQSATQGMRSKLNYTWVLPASGIPKNEKKPVCAFYTLSICHIERKELPQNVAKKFPNYPLPVFIIAQLGVDKSCQGQGLGAVVFINALRRCNSLSQNGKVPAIAVILDVLDHDAMSFYRQFDDFEELETSSSSVSRLYIPMNAVSQL